MNRAPFYTDILYKKAMISLYRSIASCILFLAVFSFYSPALAGSCNGPPFSGKPCSFFNGECTGGGNPVAISDYSGGMAAICQPTDSANAWAYPKLEVLTMPATYTWTGIGALKLHINRERIDASKCAWLGGIIRFCVRTAKPSFKNPDGTTTPAEHGWYSANNNVALCAYEDSMDADSNPFSSPYHKGSNYNTIVPNAVGCTDRTIGPLPLAWRNSAWFDNSLPNPLFVEEVGDEYITGHPISVFESPRIKMKQCKDSANKLVSCPDQGTTPPTGVTVIVPIPILNPNAANGYKDCSTDSASRTFCATISKDLPSKVIISLLANDGTYTPLSSCCSVQNPADQTWAKAQAIPRPGYMPKPSITATPGSDEKAPKIDVTLRGLTKTLALDPGLFTTTPTPTAGWDFTLSNTTIHQVAFNIDRPCAAGHFIAGVCNQYLNLVCLQGYSTAPLTNTTIATDAPITGAPNVLKPANTAFANNNATFENGAALQEQFPSTVWAFIPPATITDTATQIVRPLSAFESGLCITPPTATPAADTTTVWKRDVPGSYTYTVGTSCTEITVEAWGGGGGGSYEDGCQTNCNYSGGAGGYVKAKLPVTEGQNLPITVGYGANSALGYGSATALSSGGSGGVIVARAGEMNYGGAGSVASPATQILIKTGENGRVDSSGRSRGTATYSNGTYGGGIQPTTECPMNGNVKGTYRAPMGGGGCSAGGTFNTGSWGKGGHGMITVQCTKTQ